MPDKLAAAAWCQRKFADQSRVSEVLHRITPENLLQLEDVFQELFVRQSLAKGHSPAEWLVIDVDMTGLAVSPTSKSYEGAAFGFMQKDKEKGYKLSCPYIGEPFGEVLGGLFDPGSVHCSTKPVVSKANLLGVNQYFHLVTTIPERMKDARALLRFYNARYTTINNALNVARPTGSFHQCLVARWPSVQFNKLGLTIQPIV